MSGKIYRGVEQLVARRAHNPKVAGSSPASATIASPLLHAARDFFIVAARRALSAIASATADSHPTEADAVPVPQNGGIQLLPLVGI